MSLQRIQEMNILVEPAAAALFEGAHPGLQLKAVEKLTALAAKPMILDVLQMRQLLLPEMKRLKTEERPAEFTVNDLSAAWLSRFSVLQQMLLKRPETAGAVSIAAANGRCTLVGQVKKSKFTELEDPTGSIQILTDRKLLPDDVIAATGRAEAGVFRAEEVFFPDVHLRESGQTMGTFGINTEADFTTNPNGTEWWNIGGLTILVHKADWKVLAEQLDVTPNQVPAELLRRRHLASPPRDVIDPVPDIFMALGAESATTGYKGTAIICAPEKAVIDLGKTGAA